MTNLREKYINETGLDFESDLKNIGFFSDGYVNWLEEIIEMLIHNSKDLYEIITWPDVQELMEEEGFDDNSVLINNEKLFDNYGNSAYLIRREWLCNIVINWATINRKQI